MRPLIKMN